MGQMLIELTTQFRIEDLCHKKGRQAMVNQLCFKSVARAAENYDFQILAERIELFGWLVDANLRSTKDMRYWGYMCDRFGVDAANTSMQEICTLLALEAIQFRATPALKKKFVNVLGLRKEMLLVDHMVNYFR